MTADRMPDKKGGSDDPEQADTYDASARSVDWQGPSIVFELMAPYIRPGQTLLDIGIGTGLGSEPFFGAGLTITGMDRSDTMLAACRKKGIARELVRHDLTVFPYPFGSGSFDHVISTGVFQFFFDLGEIIHEVARLLPDGGRFAFITGDRRNGGPRGIVAGPEQTGTEGTIPMFCHTPDEIAGWLEAAGLQPRKNRPFTVWMDERRTQQIPLRAYLAAD